MVKINCLLLLIVIWLQYSLWLGKNGMFDLIHNYNTNNLYKNTYNLDCIKNGNNQILSDIHNLLNENEIIEEYARFNLGMVKSDEVFYKIRCYF